jgi:hypothetical protein
VFLFWSLVHTSSYKKLQSTRWVHLAHIISVVVALVIPLPAALIHFDEGHVSVMTPTYTCIGRDTAFTYYTYVLPFSILLAITACLLAFMIWTVVQVRLID